MSVSDTFEIKVLGCSVKDITNYDIFVDRIFSEKPDIICLYDCPKSIEKLVRCFKVYGYIHSRSECMCIFSKTSFQPTKKDVIKFSNSLQNKDIIIYTYQIKSGKEEEIRTLKICGCQFDEGGTGGGIRKFQFRDVGYILDNHQPKENVSEIIICDTCTPKWQDDITRNRTPGDDWYDSWREKGSCSNESTNSKTGDRPDRIWYRGIICKSHDNFTPYDGSTKYGVIAMFGI